MQVVDDVTVAYVLKKTQFKNSNNNRNVYESLTAAFKNSKNWTLKQNQQSQLT